MSKSGTSLVVHEQGKPLPEIDWSKAVAMTEEEVHAAALSDPDAQPLPLDGKGLRELVNVKRLRERLGMTQEDFSSIYGIPLGTLRDWEQRRKNPDKTARAYLEVIDRDPETVAKLRNAA